MSKNRAFYFPLLTLIVSAIGVGDRRRLRDFALRLFLAVTVLAGASGASAQAWGRLRVQGKQIVDQNGNNVILRGLDPGEWYNIEAYMIKSPDNDNGPVFYGASLIRSTLIDLMGKSATDEFYRRWEANIVTESDVQKWASLGVNSARLSINYHWLTTSDGVYLDSGWQRIDRFIEWCKKAHIWVILCLHAAPGAQSGLLMADGAGTAKLWTESSVYRPWTIHLWQAIAKRYARNPQSWDTICSTSQFCPRFKTINYNRSTLTSVRRFGPRIQTISCSSRGMTSL